MFIITSKSKNILLMTGERLDYMDNGYPRIIDHDTAFRVEDVNVIELSTVPPEAEPYKYCYTKEKGFYSNPDYREPDQSNTYGISDDVYRAIKEQAISEVQKGATNG